MKITILILLIIGLSAASQSAEHAAPTLTITSSVVQTSTTSSNAVYEVLYLNIRYRASGNPIVPPQLTIRGRVKLTDGEIVIYKSFSGGYSRLVDVLGPKVLQAIMDQHAGLVAGLLAE